MIDQILGFSLVFYVFGYLFTFGLIGHISEFENEDGEILPADQAPLWGKIAVMRDAVLWPIVLGQMVGMSLSIGRCVVEHGEDKPEDSKKEGDT